MENGLYWQWCEAHDRYKVESRFWPSGERRDIVIAHDGACHGDDLMGDADLAASFHMPYFAAADRILLSRLMRNRTDDGRCGELEVTDLVELAYAIRTFAADATELSNSAGLQRTADLVAAAADDMSLIVLSAAGRSSSECGEISRPLIQ